MSSCSSTSDANEYDELCKAAETGSLSGVKILVKQLQDQHASTKFLEHNLQKGLEAACRFKQSAVISYLLDYGAELNPDVVYSVLGEDTPVSIFETFLNHGWDVNELVGGLERPPLRYVVQ
jgi:hypothetical protein